MAGLAAEGAAAAAEGSGAEAALAGAAGGAGGGEGSSPLAFEISLNLNELINPIGQHLYEVFSGDTAIEMPEAAQAYPATWTPEQFTQATATAQRNWAQPLEWDMAQDSWWPADQMSWKLIAHWQCVFVPTSDGQSFVYLIDNARAMVDCSNTGWGWKLNVSAQFDHPGCVNGIASLPVWFHIKVTDGTSNVERDTMRGFEIRGDGTTQVVQGA